MHVDAVLQSQITEQQQPNVVISPISNSTVVEIKQAVIEQPKEEVVAAPVDDDAKPSESTGDNATADQQPTTGTNTTETPTSPETPPSSTGETGTPSGASDLGAVGGTGTSDTAAESEPAPAPTT